MAPAAPEIVERGRQAGLALGDEPASYVADLAGRVREKLAAYDASYVLTTIAGGMRLDEYLRTRTFELVVHGLDIEAASGVAPAFAQAAAGRRRHPGRRGRRADRAGAGPPARRDRPGHAAGGVQHRLSGRFRHAVAGHEWAQDGAWASP